MRGDLIGVGARFGFGHLYWGASAIVVLGMALELTLLAGISAANDGRLTRGLGVVMRLISWSPFIWLGVTIVYCGVYQSLAKMRGDDIRRRLYAMAACPLGTGLIMAATEALSNWKDGLFFLVAGAIFGFATLALPLCAAGVWISAQRSHDTEQAKAGEVV